MKETEKLALPEGRLAKITLKRRTSEREKSQHPWIFSNEITESKRIAAIPAGTVVEVLDCHGDYLGTGILHPKSLIAVRLLSRARKEKINADFFASRIEGAIFVREMIYGKNTDAKSTYRAVFGESDGLPGFILDRFQDVWVMQFHSLGMWQLRAELIEALKTVVENVEGPAGIRCIIVRTDVQSHNLEGMEKASEIAHGELPKSGARAFEAGVEFPVDPVGGQKTGFYFDQRENRRVFLNLVAARKAAGAEVRVADLFCHVGAWGLTALAAGADHATFLDSSQPALDVVKGILKARGWEKRATIICGEAKEELKKIKKSSFDLISLDPPSFIPSKKSLVPGLKAYAAINGAAGSLLKAGGIIATASCSHNCDEDRFELVTAQALRAVGLDPKIIHRGGPAMDHPPRPGMPESKYLKSIFYGV